MADTSYGSSAPDYPNLQGGNSSASNMKNSVANCKVRASRKQARHGWILPAGYVQIRREELPGHKTLAGARLGVCHFPVIRCLPLLLSLCFCWQITIRKHFCKPPSSKLTPDKQYLH
jgi:hypothetical protein